MNHLRVYAEIDLDALCHNISLIEKKLPHGVGLMPIIKADAYGHGAVPFARALSLRAAYFGVAAVDEAMELRSNGIDTPILVLGHTHPAFFPIAVEKSITLTVFSLEDATVLNDVAKAAEKKAVVHIAADTGMSRIGFRVNDSDADTAAAISDLEYIEVEGLFSHFATADEADKSSALMQRDSFLTFCRMMSERGVDPRLIHLDNSAGIMEMEDSFFHLVRAGIIIYGLYPSDEMDREKFPLMPVMSLRSHISHIKTLPEGVGISYNHTFVTEKETRVATIPVGYADGYPRALSGIGHVLINGVSCPILGRICMDQMMVDVTHVPNVCTGDPVTLLGRDGDAVISAEELSEPAASFNYEFVCGIGRRVPRIYIKDGVCVDSVSYLESSQTDALKNLPPL